MSGQMDFAERLGRIEKGDSRIISRSDMVDSTSVNSIAKKKRVELLDIGGRKPYWRYVFLKTVLITVLMLFSFRAVAHLQGVDMSERRARLAKGDSNEKLAAAIIGFSMIADPLYIRTEN